MSSETWLPVKGYEDYYEVSNQGRVRSMERDVALKSGEVRHYKSRYLSEARDSKGYCTCHLAVKGKNKAARFHRLVAEAFIPNPKGLPQVNHIDGNKRNNAVENLEWVTDEQNKAHAAAHGLAPLFSTEKKCWVRRSA